MRFSRTGQASVCTRLVMNCTPASWQTSARHCRAPCTRAGLLSCTYRQAQLQTWMIKEGPLMSGLLSCADRKAQLQMVLATGGSCTRADRCPLLSSINREALTKDCPCTTADRFAALTNISLTAATTHIQRCRQLFVSKLEAQGTT